MKRRETRVWLVRGAIVTALLVPLLLWMSGCCWFSTPPEAGFTSATIVEVGEAVAFSAILSSAGPGRIIVKFEWDFGDGGSATGESVTHTYTATGTYTVVLRVTDDCDKTSTAQKVLTVNPADGNGNGGGPGPNATFTATPLTGQSPLTVTFNASASTAPGMAITAYFWDFGDGTTGAGITTTHTYGPTVTTTYNVVLRVIAEDNSEDTDTKSVTVTVAGAAPPEDAPTASFTTAPNRQLAPLEVDCDPENSEATAGRWLEWFFWTFGDGSTRSEVTDVIVPHRYVTDQAEEEFVITLTVIDNEGDSDVETRTVVIENYQPVAGFEVFDEIQAGAPAWDDTTEPGVWVTDDEIHYYDVQTGPNTIWIQSQDIVNNDVAWRRTTADPEPVGNENSEPAEWDDNNYSYDPEGQEWNAGIPAGFPSPAWGIETFRVDWGDGDSDTFDYQAAALPGDDDHNQISHAYDFQPPGGQGTDSFIIEVTVWDYLSGMDSFSREIFFHTSPEP